LPKDNVRPLEELTLLWKDLLVKTYFK
jgi:hypothetical protein